MPAVGSVGDSCVVLSLSMSFLWGQAGQGVHPGRWTGPGMLHVVTERQTGRTRVDVHKWCLVARRQGHSLMASRVLGGRWHGPS